MVMKSTMPDESFKLPSLPPRRVMFSDDAPSDAPHLSPLPAHEPSKPPQEMDDRKGETRHVVTRLLAIIEDHRISAQRLHVTLDAAALDTVLLALEAEIRRENPAPILEADGDEIRSYTLTALYEDLLAEPSNILFTTHIATDVVRYEAMEVAFWAECIAALRTTLIP